MPKKEESCYSLVLTTGRTLRQGISMENGKLEPSYSAETGQIYIDKTDAEKLAISKEDLLEIRSEHGEIILPCTISKEHHPGIAFIPMGPFANQLVDPETNGTGMPSFKNVPIQVRHTTNKSPTTLEAILNHYRGIKNEEA